MFLFSGRTLFILSSLIASWNVVGYGSDVISHSNNYSNLPESCDDGFYIKLNSQTQRHRMSHKKLEPGQFHCESCDCDKIGSKTLTCDKRSGRCVCLENHIGPKCDRCLPGYHRTSTISGDVSSERCMECGDCYKQSMTKLADLKNDTVQGIQFASNSGSRLASRLNLQQTQFDNLSRITFTDNGIFEEIDSKMTKIDDTILTNKYYGDRLIMATMDLKLLLVNKNTTGSDIMNLTGSYQKLARLKPQLNEMLEVTQSIVSDLEMRVVEKFRLDHMEFLADLPIGAHRILKNNHFRSKLYRDTSTKLYDNFSNEHNTQIQTLRERLEILEKFKSESDRSYLKIMNESVESYELETPLDLALPAILNESSFGRIDRVIDMSESSIIDVEKELQRYLPETDRLIKELDLDRVILSDADTIIEQISGALDRIDHDITKLRSSFFGDRLSNFDPLDQILDNTTQSLRMNVDKVDARWTSARSEIVDIFRLRSENSLSDKILELSLNINKTLETNIANFHNLYLNTSSDFNELPKLIERVSILAYNVSSMNEIVAEIAKLRREANVTIEETRVINHRTRDTMNAIRSIITSCDIDGVHNESTLLNTDILRTAENSQNISNLSSEISELKDKMTKLQIRILMKQLYSNNNTERQEEELTLLNESNENLLMQLRANYSDLSYLSSIAEDKQIGIELNPISHDRGDETKIRAISLDRRRRQNQLKTNYMNVSRTLFEMLTKTSGLIDEFKQNQIVFSNYDNMIHKMNGEMLNISAELEIKLEVLSQTC